MKTLKWVGRTLFFEPFAIRLAMMITLLFSSIPPVHAVIGPYVKLLLVWGAAVMMTDLFTRRRALRNRYAGFLALFVLAYIVSILLNRASGMSENISMLAYTVVFFFVLFAYDPDGSPERLAWEVKVLARVFVLITALFALVCFGTFLLSIKHWYVEQTTAEYSTVVVIGMSGNRLFGLYSANTGSTLNLLSSVFSLLLLSTGKPRPVARVAHGLNLALQYFCLLLTLSRTSWFMYAFFIALFVFFVLPTRGGSRRPRVAEGVKAAVAVTAAALVILLSVPVKAVLAYAPGVVQTLLATDATPSVDGGTAVDPDVEPSKPITPVEIERPGDENVGGVLTGRTYLWYGGLQAFFQHPLFGTTRAGLHDAAADHIPEVWRVNLLRGGLHNIALMVLACSGGVGFVIMLGFVLLSGGRALKWMWQRRGDRAAMLCNILIALIFTILGIEMFESRILYTTTIFGAIFWMFYGYAMQLVDACEPEKAACTGAYNRLARRLSERTNGRERKA